MLVRTRNTTWLMGALGVLAAAAVAWGVLKPAPAEARSSSVAGQRHWVAQGHVGWWLTWWVENAPEAAEGLGPWKLDTSMLHDAAGERPAAAEQGSEGTSTGEAEVAGGDDPGSGDGPDIEGELFVEPDNPAGTQADEWRSSRPDDAALMDRLGEQPVGKWIGEWSGDVREAVDTHVTAAHAHDSLPVLVAYNIPVRDCAQHSDGGAPSGEAYEEWIAQFSEGIDDRPSIVILEPDALTLTDCLDEGQYDERFGLLAEAVRTLGSNAETAVYVDAGHSGWREAGEVADRLRDVGIEEAAGFALNTSNFQATDESIEYGRTVSEDIDGETSFVIDTGRNGAGAADGDDGWCNPSDRAFGETPTTDTGEDLVDAYLWAKVPGESDGECHGGPPAGEWWGEYALGLAQRAGW